MNDDREQNRETTIQFVFARIEREHIVPRPRWHFITKEGFIISLGIFSVTSGALAVAAMLFEGRNTWWSYYDTTHSSLFGFVVDALPYVWFFGFCLFAGAAYASIRYTKRGYRYSLKAILGGSVALSGLLGVALYGTGFGAFIDEDIGAFVPFHRSLVAREHALWAMPESGRIAGTVREISLFEPVVWIESFDGEPYQIDVTDFSADDRLAIRIGEIVRVVGLPTTTPLVLHGCLFLMQPDDVLQHMRTTVGSEKVVTPGARINERNLIVARSTSCRDVRPYARLAPGNNKMTPSK